MEQIEVAPYLKCVVWLMMPGGALDLVRKGRRFVPDVIIPCLEDGVAYDDVSKERARQDLAGFIKDGGLSADGIRTFPRVNHPSTKYCVDDIDALVAAGVEGIVIPKCESTDEINSVDEAIAASEARAGRAPGSVGVVVMVETALGVQRVFELSSFSRRTVAVLFGREDYSASIGLMRRHKESLEQGSPELLYARSKVALAARAAGIGAIDGASFTFVEEEYMQADASLSARLGYTAKLAAHPAHVKAIIHGFTPTDEDVDVARRILELETRALGAGEATLGGIDGMEVTPPIADQARLLVERAEWSRTKAEQRDRLETAS